MCENDAFGGKERPVFELVGIEGPIRQHPLAVVNLLRLEDAFRPLIRA